MIESMGNVVHHYVSFHSFVMGVLWFNAFVALGLLMRRMKFPVTYSAIPLLLLLVLSILRMFVAINIPGVVIITSETLYPAIISFLWHEIVPYRVLGLPITPINVFNCVWAIGAIWMIIRYLYDYVIKFHPTMRWFESYRRDEDAEKVLRDEIGSDKRFRVYRNKSFSTAIATAFRPYIVLPEIDFTPEELRVILLHEWKHIKDKDYLAGVIVNIICAVFWWNPMAYILKRNFRFAQELKCDQYAVADKKDYLPYLSGIHLLGQPKNKKNRYISSGMANGFISGDDGLYDRLILLDIRQKRLKALGTLRKQLLRSIGTSIAICVLFIVSYTVLILPVFRTPGDVLIGECPMKEYLEIEVIFAPVENSIVDNGDGTFSLYIEGQFVEYVDSSSDIMNWLPIRERE